MQTGRSWCAYVYSEMTDADPKSQKSSKWHLFTIYYLFVSRKKH